MNGPLLRHEQGRRTTPYSNLAREAVKASASPAAEGISSDIMEQN